MTIGLQEAAAFFDMHPDTLRRMAKKGDVPAKKVGKKWRFVKSQLEDWIAEPYIDRRQASQKEEICEVRTALPRGVTSGTLDSLPQMERLYEEAVKPK